MNEKNGHLIDRRCRLIVLKVLVAICERYEAVFHGDGLQPAIAKAPRSLFF